MTDRELLELAAKAAGVKASWFEDSTPEEGMRLDGERSPDNSSFWAPLATDGDALRLAVTLQLAVYRSRRGITAEFQGRHFDEPTTPDPYAATRRAIVRAAAEIGESINPTEQR